MSWPVAKAAALTLVAALAGCDAEPDEADEHETAASIARHCEETTASQADHIRCYARQTVASDYVTEQMLKNPDDWAECMPELIGGDLWVPVAQCILKRREGKQ